MASPAQMDRDRMGLDFSGNPRGFSYKNPAKTNASKMISLMITANDSTSPTTLIL